VTTWTGVFRATGVFFYVSRDTLSYPSFTAGHAREVGVGALRAL
jgi:hypothetical protein